MLFSIFDSTYEVLIVLILLHHFLVFVDTNLPDGYKLPSWVPFIPRHNSKLPVSVNHHFTRRCNKACGFRSHTTTTSHIEDLPHQKAALRLLAEAGVRKINFAGGEPFLYPKLLGAMIDYCKNDLNFESISIVSNGSLTEEDFFRDHAAHLDILTISCDSFNEQTNIDIGRGSSDQVQKLYQIADWCRQYGVLFKLNTVVNNLNAGEDMNAHIAALQPFQWKAFQVLIVRGENDSEETLRNKHKFAISDEAFDEFCARHKAQKCLVPEPNRHMAKGHLILDEYLRFLDRTGSQPSKPILEVGVDAALESVFWDEKAFVERGGLYDWAKLEEEKGGCGGGADSEVLAW